MKRRYLITIATLLSVFSFAFLSCNENDEGDTMITVNGKSAVSLTIEAEGGTQTVLVKGTGNWVAESVDWITVNPTSGAAGKEVSVAITAEANDGEERMGGVSFTLPTKEFIEVIVVQKEADAR